MKKSRYILAGVTLCGMLLGLTAYAQQPAATPQAARGDAQRPAATQPALTPAQRKTVSDIENFYINQFSLNVSKLGISEEQSLKVLVLLRDYVQKQQTWAARKVMNTNRLELLVKSQGPSEEILDQLDLIEKSENNLRSTRRQFFLGLGSMELMLNAQQQGKLFLFMRDTDEKVLEFLMRAK